MKRSAFIKYLKSHNCRLKRHGARHDIFINDNNGFKAPVPRHNELKNSLAEQIKKQLGLK